MHTSNPPLPQQTTVPSSRIPQVWSFRVAGRDHRIARLDQGVADVPERLEVVIHRQDAHLFPPRPREGPVES